MVAMARLSKRDFGLISLERPSHATSIPAIVALDMLGSHFNLRYPNAVRLSLQQLASDWILALTFAPHVASRISKLAFFQKPVQGFRSWLDRYPLVRELVSEGRSFLHRIQLLCKQRLWDTGVDLGPAFDPQSDADGFLVPSVETTRRTLGIEMLLAKYPWASSFDMELFLLGFQTAGCIPVCNDHIESEFQIS